MTNKEAKRSTDLKQRILKFVLGVIFFIKKLPENRVNHIIIDQIVRSASSIGSNYEEADGTSTKKDFVYKMGVVKKEAKETKYWLKLFRLTNDKKCWNEIDALGIENEELIRIFAKIIINAGH